MQNPQPPTVAAVVFDFGGVFTESPVAVAHRAATARGVDPELFVDFMLGSYGVESNHPWQRAERGELGLDDVRTWARAETMRQFGVEIDPYDIMSELMNSPVRPEMVKLVADLRNAGFRTAMLTNNARELAPMWRLLTDWNAIFNAIVDSSEIGCRKPSAEAFDFALNTLGVENASEALMVDDFDVNVDGARAIGMQAVRVDEDPTDAIRAIRTATLDRAAALGPAR